MKTSSPRTTERDLQRLATLIGIHAGHGWKARLAEWFGVNLSILSNWVRRGLPRNKIEYVVKKGFPKEKWLSESPQEPPVPSKSGQEGVRSSPGLEISEPMANYGLDPLSAKYIASLESQVALLKESNENLRRTLTVRDMRFNEFKRTLQEVVDTPTGRPERRRSHVEILKVLSSISQQTEVNITLNELEKDEKTSN